MKILTKPRIYFCFLLLAITCNVVIAQPCGIFNNFSTSVTVSASQAPNSWYPDRYAPAGFISPSTDPSGGNSLKETISTSDAAANRAAGQQSSFYNTQGRRIDLISGTQSIEIKMYVPAAWATSGKRMAGFWGETRDASNANPSYPIVEFTSSTTDVDGSGPRFRGWEDGSGTWVNLGLPTGFAYNSWVTIRMAISPSSPGQFTYTIGNTSYTTNSVTTAPVRIASAILQGHNYDPSQPIDATNTGVNYDIYWDDFVQSTQNNGSVGFTIRNVNNNSYYCSIQSAIDNASANDSITIAGGSYFEQLSINKSLSFSGAGAGMCGTGARPANETKLIAPNTGQLLNFSGAITVNFDGIEIDSANVGAITGANQNLGIRNSLFKLNFKPASNNLYFSAGTLTLECNSFKAISGSNDGSSSHLFFAGNTFNAVNNSFTSVDAISSMNASTTSLPLWINLTTGANNVNIQYNFFTKVDIGILLADNAGNIKIWNNEFSEAKRESYSFGSGMGTGIALFQNFMPAGPVSIRYNKFYNSEDGIRTSGSGTTFPTAKLLSISYNSFESMSDKAIRINGSYSGASNKLNATCNWFGNITGPVIGTNAGANTNATQILDGGGAVTYKNWLNYGTDANGSLLGFQLPTMLNVAPGNNASQAENHYRVLSNAIGCVAEGQTMNLSGTFDFSNAIAQTEWSKGNNGLFDNEGSNTGAGGDDYTITAPDSTNNVTITAASLGSATILSPGDVDTVSLETPLFLDSRSASSSHKKWTISNLIFNGFDVSILADNNGGPINAMDSFMVTNNRFTIPADWNSTVKPKDNFQNIGINLNFGKGQMVTNNTFYVDGTGVSDIANGRYSTSVVLQSNTSGGNAYDGLKIDNNSIHVTGVPDASPAKIIGLWENSNNQTSAIELSANSFVNDDAGNLPTNNNQLAFVVTSFSGDASHQVVYKNNEVTGFNRAIAFIGDTVTSYGANTYGAGESPVIIINNKIDRYRIGVSIIKDPASPNPGSPAIINNNSFTHIVSGGFAISNLSSGTTPATCNYYDTALVGNIIHGSVAYLPRLSNGIDASPATGFQVDPSNACVSPITDLNTGNTYVTIQAAIDDPTTLNGHTIQVGPGIYPENVTVSKSLTIQGPNQTTNPNTGSRATEAYVVPAVNNITDGRVFNVTANNVTIKGFTIDGDNKNISGGTGLNGVDINAATGIGTGLYSSIDGSSNLLVENNILQNFDNRASYTGAIYGNGSQSSAITGNIFRNNKINNSNFWGILTEANYYANIQNNVIDSVNRGIQIDGFFIPASGPTTISGNTVGYYKRGITVNNNFGTASQFMVSGNTIAPRTSGTNENGNMGAVADNRGIAVWSMYSGTNGTALANNKITGASYGMELWNIAPGKLTATGDSILNSTNIGIIIPTQQPSFGSAGYGSFATITQATITGSVNDGIRVTDNDATSGTTAQINLTNSFVIGGVNNIVIDGPEIDASTAINSNSLTGASALAIDASSYTGAAAINATCNWFGTVGSGAIAASVSGQVTYSPYLLDGTDAQPATRGFQPAATCGTVNQLYVNDNSQTGDHYTTAVGNDNNPGTPAAPFATITYAIGSAAPGDTIYVDAGTYKEDYVFIYQKQTIKGSNYGIDPNTGTRMAESIVQSNLNPAYNTMVYIDPAASNSRFDGFTVDGSNMLNGVYAYPTTAADNISHDTISNNIIQHIGINGVVLYNDANSAAGTGNVVAHNKFLDILQNPGTAVLIYNNAYTNITDNVMNMVRIGVQTGNFYRADTANNHTISNNAIESQVLGVWTNLHQSNSAKFNVTNNTLTNFGSASPVQSIGLRVQSISNNVGVNVSNNNVTGNKYGVALINCPTTDTITISGGTLSSNTVGVFATNTLNANNVNAASSAYIINGVNIQGASYAGVEVADTSATTNGSSVAFSVRGNTTINNTTTGLLLQGKKASASFTGAMPAMFTGQTKYIDQITNGTNVPGTNIDATMVSFDGQLGSAMSLANLYNTEDKINHKIDADSLGFVLVKANNDYVTPLSFVAPSAMPKIQRGVNAASNGFTVNVKAGTYKDNVTVNKSLTILGAQSGQNANTRFAAFTNLKADSTIETVVTTPTNNPVNGNPNANDLFRVIANNVVIDGFTIDGNNPALPPSTVMDNTGLSIHARRAITNIDTTDNFNPVSNLTVRNNIMQNVAQRGVSLNNNGPVSTGNLITGNVIRNFGWDPTNGGQGVILFTNAYADITNNTIDVPHDQIGLHLQNFYTDGSMTWSGNNVTVGQNAFGIHANNFYAPAGVLNVSGNTVNAAAGVTGNSDSTWGINVWSIQSGSTVNIANNTVGNSGGAFARGINLWNMPTTNMVTVNGGTVANAMVGVNLDNVDLYFGAGNTTITKVTGTTITASRSGVRARAASLLTPPSSGSNMVSGSVSLTLDNVPINVSGTTKGVEANAPAASAPYMATVYLTNGTTVNNTTTSDTAVLISGNQAELYAATSNIKAGTAGAHNAIQFSNIINATSVSNLVLAGGTTINLNSNNAAKAFASPQYSIVEVDAGAPGWTAPDSAANGNQSILIDGAMKFTSGILNSGNSTIEFGNEATDIMTGSSPENTTSYILGKAKMLSRPVGNNALDFLGAKLAAQGGVNANVGNMEILRTTLLSGAINPPFPGNNSIRTTWGITPSNPTSSRSDVAFRYLNTPTNLNGQNPNSIYSYRYSGGQWNKISATLSSTLTSSGVFTTGSFGVPGFSPWTLSSQSSTAQPDFKPIVVIDNLNFQTAGTSRDFFVNISEISGQSGTINNQLKFRINKPNAFTITYDPNATSSTADGGTTVQNGDWDFDNSNASFVIVTLKVGKSIPSNGSSNIGFSIQRNNNVSANTTQSITTTIFTGTGGDSNINNNQTATNITAL